MSDSKVLRLFPAPHNEGALEGLYLEDDLGHAGFPEKPFVYTNFISSLDGRPPSSLRHTIFAESLCPLETE